MKRSTEYSIILLLIFISLLVHMSGLLFTMFKAPSAQTIAQQKKPFKLPVFKDNRQAAMQARKSNFGAPVVFAQQPQTKQSPKKPSVTPEKQKPAVKKIKPQKIETKPKKVEIKQTTFVELEKKTQSNVTKKQKSTTPKKTPKSVDKPVEKETPKPQKAQDAPPPPQKKVTLASLASGFLNHMKDKGKYNITMKGDKNKVPNQEQLNIAQYGKKLLWQVQNSYRINKHMLYNLPKNITADFIIGVSIPRNGIGATCQLLQSTGSALVDSCLLFIYEQATTALPPIPSYITQQPLRISVRDHTDTTKFKQRNNLAFSGSRRRFGP